MRTSMEIGGYLQIPVDTFMDIFVDIHRYPSMEITILHTYQYLYTHALISPTSMDL